MLAFFPGLLFPTIAVPPADPVIVKKVKNLTVGLNISLH
jgi:hypothetical protein